MRCPSPICLALLAQNLFSASISLVIEGEISPIDFGLEALAGALDARGHQLVEVGGQPLHLSLRPDLPAQGFVLHAGDPVKLQGGDTAGIMYGLLELAEQIRLFDLEGIESTIQSPSQLDRGIKYNIPLDLRTPTYTEPSDAAQQAMDETWDLDYWKAMIDHLARHRYNMISLWNLHPFPSLVKVPEYPDVALDDVRRSTGRWDENYSLNGLNFDTPEILENYETLRVMTIEDKVAFWREVMAYAKSRHIKFYLITWNIFVYGTKGKYGIDDRIHNSTTRDYFRASVRALLRTYPDLGGVGLTTGENMHGANFEEKELWAYETYGLGALDVAREDPDRQIRFIHRQHQTKARDIATQFDPLVRQPNIDFVFSYKYAKAHVMSSTRQPYGDQFIQDIPPQKTLWTLRNDSNYLYRWGGARFVREFIQGIPEEVSAGMYYGSDQWVWAREFLSKQPHAPRELELSKHWFHWLLWGRLAYDPKLSDKRLIAILASRFSGIDASRLFEAWNAASEIYPITTGFHWGALDFQWYIEGGQSHPIPAETPSGFHDINRFISLQPHPGTDNRSIEEFVTARMENKAMVGTTPLEVAQALLTRAHQALSEVDAIELTGDSDLWQTLEDIRTMAYLGKYYAHKITAATALEMARRSWDRAQHEIVSRELNAAAHAWRQYLARSVARYENPLWTNRVGYVDLRENFSHVLYDMTMCGVDIAIASMEPTPGGTLLEAEEEDNALQDTPGYTGRGYRLAKRGDNTIKWTFDAPREGLYILEIRHAQRRNHPRISAHLEVNGIPISDFDFTGTGGLQTWAWDRAYVPLEKGLNTIQIKPGNDPFIDHLNVIPTDL